MIHNQAETILHEPRSWLHFLAVFRISSHTLCDISDIPASLQNLLLDSLHRTCGCSWAVLLGGQMAPDILGNLCCHHACLLCPGYHPHLDLFHGCSEISSLVQQMLMQDGRHSRFSLEDDLVVNPHLLPHASVLHRHHLYLDVCFCQHLYHAHMPGCLQLLVEVRQRDHLYRYVQT